MLQSRCFTGSEQCTVTLAWSWARPWPALLRSLDQALPSVLYLTGPKQCACTLAWSWTRLCPACCTSQGLSSAHVHSHGPGPGHAQHAVPHRALAVRMYTPMGLGEAVPSVLYLTGPQECTYTLECSLTRPAHCVCKLACNLTRPEGAAAHLLVPVGCSAIGSF
jgi:hypothetical protein